MPSLISNTIALIGGAAVGAAAMYLLDPDLGEDRRKDVSGTASDAVSSTRSALGSTVSGASDSAHSVANTIGKYSKRFAGQASGAASSTADSLSDAAGSAADAVKSAHKATKKNIGDVVDAAVSYGSSLFTKASKKKDDWLDTAASTANQAKSTGWHLFKQVKATHDGLHDRAASAVSRAKSAGRKAVEPESNAYATAGGITAGTLGVLAVGAAMMYFLDPERGRTRRALAQAKAYSLSRQSGNKIRRYGHHLGNKAYGYAAQARQVVPAEWAEKLQSVVAADGGPAKATSSPAST